MQIHYETPSDVARYLERRQSVSLQEKEPEFEKTLALLRRFHPVGEATRILEIGTGLGWFPILCKLRGLQCKGLEISPDLIAHARKLGRSAGIEPDIELGNIEEKPIGTSEYDVIMAASVFEHVQYWRTGLRRVYDALKPGGLFFFESTNKFSLTSGEYDFPLYGWLPDRLRYRLRVARQGPDIMKLGIDFNQFTYPLLRREFRRLGFTTVLDRVQIMDSSAMPAWRRALVRTAQRVAPLRSLTLLFRETTIFVCIK